MTNEKDILLRAIAELGVGGMIDMMIEKMSKLTISLIGKRSEPDDRGSYDNEHEVCDITTDNIITDIADVQVMLDQMKLIYDCHGVFQLRYERRLEELDYIINCRENGIEF